VSGFPRALEVCRRVFPAVLGLAVAPGIPSAAQTSAGAPSLAPSEAQATPAKQSKPLEFALEVSAVHVDAFVARGDKPLADLTAAHFDVRDNGVPQRIELVSAESRPLRVVMVFDTSSSMFGERIVALRAAAEAFLDGLRPQDEAGLVGFHEDVLWLAEPTSDRALVRRALERLEPFGATAYDALYAGIALSEGDRRTLVVLFTDGEDNSSWLSEADLRLVAQRSNALVHVVGWRKPQATTGRARAPALPRLTESLQERALREIAEAAAGRFWTAESPDHLRRVFREIAEAMGQRYVLRYEPVGVSRAGWHRLDVRLRGVRGDVQVRSGYWVAVSLR
jgi:VWFA-related protein